MATILLAEDDELIARMISLRLELAGHQVEIAENGRICVEKVRARNFDLILMDMHMPVMDGHEAVKLLRSEAYSGSIVAVTASAMSEESQRAITSGCDAFIAKPIGEDFEQQVKKYLNQAG